jgi:hypothetical protein
MKSKIFISFCKISFFLLFCIGNSSIPTITYANSPCLLLLAQTDVISSDEKEISQNDSEKIDGGDTLVSSSSESISGGSNSETILEKENLKSGPIETTANFKEAKISSRTGFYQKWWFTLIFVLIAIPFLYRTFKRKNQDHEREIKIFNLKIEELHEELQEKELQHKESEKKFLAQLEEEQELKFQTV